jgi:ATP-dependent RNA helicase RhlB
MTFSSGDDAEFTQGGASGAEGSGEGRDGAASEAAGTRGGAGTTEAGEGHGGSGAHGASGAAEGPEAGQAGEGSPAGEGAADGAGGGDLPAEEDERPDKPNFLTTARFYDFDLPPKILEGLDAAGFLYATPIQAKVIPEAMKGKDIAGQAQTGTGKTVAFLVPVMARLLTKPPAKPGIPRALVITPTRELAEQIYSDGKKLASYTGLTLSLIIGGMDYHEQARALEAGPDIVVGTPGRLTDYIHKRIFNTSGVEVTVVDEADRLLELGFIRDLKFILSRLPSYEIRQTMFFSATLSHQILELVYQFMNPPQYITAEPGPRNRVQIVQELYHVSRAEKLPLLLGLLRREEHSRVLIFCNTKSGVDWLAKKLVGNGFHAEGITGDLPQPKRLRLMQSFKDNQLDIMVATDVASRGIHVEDVSHVFNYDLPQDAEDYVHRIGRTARAGKTGKAVSFACEEYVHHLEAIENILGEKIPVSYVDDDLLSADRSAEARRRDPKPLRDRPRDGDPRGDGQGPSAGPSREPRGAPHRGSGPKPGYNGKEARDGRDVRDEIYFARGLAFSSRPGGIFGLAPRQPVTAASPDVRFELTWKPEDIKCQPSEIPRPRPALGRGAQEGGAAEPQARAAESGSWQAPEHLPDREPAGRADGQDFGPAGAFPAEDEAGRREATPAQASGNGKALSPEAPHSGREAAPETLAGGAASEAAAPQAEPGQAPAQAEPGQAAVQALPGSAEGLPREGGRRRRRHRSRHKDGASFPGLPREGEAAGKDEAAGPPEGADRPADAAPPLAAEAPRVPEAPGDDSPAHWSPSPYRSYVNFHAAAGKSSLPEPSIREDIPIACPLPQADAASPRPGAAEGRGPAPAAGPGAPEAQASPPEGPAPTPSRRGGKGRSARPAEAGAALQAVTAGKPAKPSKTQKAAEGGQPAKAPKAAEGGQTAKASKAPVGEAPAKALDGEAPAKAPDGEAPAKAPKAVKAADGEAAGKPAKAAKAAGGALSKAAKATGGEAAGKPPKAAKAAEGGVSKAAKATGGEAADKPPKAPRTAKAAKAPDGAAADKPAKAPKSPKPKDAQVAKAAKDAKSPKEARPAAPRTVKAGPKGAVPGKED